MLCGQHGAKEKHYAIHGRLCPIMFFFLRFFSRRLPELFLLHLGGGQACEKLLVLLFGGEGRPRPSVRTVVGAVQLLVRELAVLAQFSGRMSAPESW